ncbi:MAG: FAD-dependent oxidoreductase [Pseudomonadota bacterium]
MALRDRGMKEKSTDVIVMGAGAWGLSVAWACARRGLSVRVVEAQRIGSGASGGLVGALSPHVPDQWNAKKQFQFEALASADQYWEDVAEVCGVDPAYGRIGRVIPILDESHRALSEARKRSAKDLWRGLYDWDVVDEVPNYLNPKTAPFGIVYETLSARIDPRRMTLALAQACHAYGVDIQEDCEATLSGEGVVRTKDRVFEAGAVVVATGVAGLEWLGRHFGKSAGGAVKGQAALLGATLGDVPQIFADGLYVIPHKDGTTAVGSTSENTWVSTGTDGQLEDVLETARTLCPSLIGAPILERWAGFRPKARRRDPMLGPIPGLRNTYAALGAFKIGLGLVPKVGDVLADYVEGGRPDVPPSFTVTHHLA